MRFSASKSPLLSLCQFPYGPGIDAPEADPGPSAKIGTSAWARVGAYFERREDPGNTEDLTPSECDDADAFYVAGLKWAMPRRRVGTRCEIAYAWSPSKDEARELPKSFDEQGRQNLRDYSDAKGDEVCGSIDLEDWDMDGSLIVEDVKTGVTPLGNYIPQARTLGLFAARRHKVRRVRIRLVKLWKDGREPEIWQDDLDGFALDAIAEDLRLRLEAAKTAAPNPGSHCTEMWCPARLVCPEVPAVVAELVPAASLIKAPRMSHEFLSHDHDARMLDFLRLIAAAGEDLKKVIKKRTPVNGAVLEDGRVLREGFHDETRWKQEQLIAKVRELAVKLAMTDEQIDQVLEDCRYTFQKSEGLKVTKSLKGKAA